MVTLVPMMLLAARFSTVGGAEAVVKVSLEEAQSALGVRAISAVKVGGVGL